MGKHIGGIVRQESPVSFAVVRKFEEEFPVLVSALKEGLFEKIPLRKE